VLSGNIIVMANRTSDFSKHAISFPARREEAVKPRGDAQPCQDASARDIADAWRAMT